MAGSLSRESSRVALNSTCHTLPVDSCQEQNRSSQAPFATRTPRFVRDGTTREDRLPNFVNEVNGQGNEAAAGRVERDTNTYTTIKHALESASTTMAMANEMEKNLWSTPSIHSSRCRFVSPETHLSQDPRFEHLRSPSPDPLGPGQYWIEGGSPNLGTLPPSSPTRGSSPSRDPRRASSAFISPPRVHMQHQSDAPPVVYVSPDIKHQSTHNIAWRNTSPAGRPDVRDYRFSSRLQDAVRTVPHDSDYTCSLAVNQAAQLVNIADAANIRRCPSPTLKVTPPPNGQTSSFRSKQQRFAQLPTGRLNDVRLSRSRSDEDPGALGPGAYAPLTSCGASRRPTYRLFAHLDPEAAIGGSPLPGGALVRRSASPCTYGPSPPVPLQHPPWPWMASCLGQNASSSFMTGSRSRSALQLGINTDSTLMLKR